MLASAQFSLRSKKSVKLYNFDLLAYPHVPVEAPRTPVPSSYFDPAKGAANYAEHLSEMAYCEELGFDGVVFNEHHYSAYGTMPSPNLIASALSQRTKKIKIGVLGNILPLRNHPVRVAEEYAMIDCLSNGRLIAGFVRGIPPEYIWYGVNPEESRGRFEEAYDLIMTAWTKPVWSHEGPFFKLHDCAIWPRPVQQPHPPIWIAARSAESVEWCVKRHLPCAQVYQTTGQIEDTFNYYRLKAKEDGWDAKPEQFILCRHIYIDDSEEKAREFATPAMAYFFTVFNRGFNEAINKDAVAKQLTAALTSERSFSYFRDGNRERFDFSKMDYDGLIKSGYMIAGNPDSVAKQIQDQMRQVGADHFMGMFHIGNLKHDKVVNSLDLFKKEIMPRLH
jgi:alkanesulfonate monooxygenase SsuD/methylene tetrahydromethanopterin reductase-like flavin-dependent oxidoreductase (luciferase family)